MANKIFVSIASYRDLDCSKTLQSLFSNASHPLNIFVGICQQNAESDPDCLLNIEPQYLANVRISRIPDIHAKGPTYARYICSSLWNNEQYYFQIDSHLLFVKGWDKKLISMINRLKQDGVLKPVISHYPRHITDYHNYDSQSSNRFNVSTICKSAFNDDSIIFFNDSQLINTNGELHENAYMAAGLFFCESSFLTDVPFDPDLDYLFFGEEILLTVRFWTNGWRIFTPSENIAFHDYHREKRPTFWANQRYSNKKALDKVREIINVTSSNQSYGKYGLGNKKTLQEYYDFAGIDLLNKTSSKSFCNSSSSSSSTSDNNHNNNNNPLSAKRIIITLIFILAIVVLIFLIIYVLFNHKNLKIEVKN